MTRPTYAPLTEAMTEKEMTAHLIGNMTLRLDYLATLDRAGFVIWNDYASRACELVDGKWEAWSPEDATVFATAAEATPGWHKLRAFDRSPIAVMPRGEVLDRIAGKIRQSIAHFEKLL